MVQVTAQLNDLRQSPRKVRLIAALVRGLPASRALERLSLSDKRAAEPVRKLIRSAVANATHNHKLLEDSLRIAAIKVDEGLTVKRWRPRAFGRAGKILKRSSRVSVTLEGVLDSSAAKETAPRAEEPAQEPLAAAQGATQSDEQLTPVMPAAAQQTQNPERQKK